MKNRKDTKTGLILRSLVAAYILYLAYGLAVDIPAAEGGRKTIVIIVAVLFAVGGGVILGFSVYRLAKGQYEESGKDIGNEASDDSGENSEDSLK